MGTPRKVCAALALMSSMAGVQAKRYVDPMVITLDGKHYVTYTAPVVVSASTRLVLAPEAQMSNCRRANGEPLQTAPFRLNYTADGGFVDAATMRLAFVPTRIVLASPTGDVICDGEALGYQTGIDRLFRDNFEPLD